VDVDLDCQLADMDLRNLCAKPECQRDSLGHAVQFPVRRRSTAARYKRHGRLLQNRIAYDGCYSGACGWWHSDSDTDIYTCSYTKCDSPAYSNTKA
jgi:hypothetical protein